MSEQETEIVREAADDILGNDDFKKSIAEMVGKAVADAVKPLAETKESDPVKKLFGDTQRSFHVKPEIKSPLGATLHALYKAKRAGGGRALAAEYAKGRWGDDNPVYKALVTTSGSDGSEFVQTTVASEVIEALRPASVVRASGAQVVQVPGGSLQIPRNAGVTGAWVGELTANNASTPSIDTVTLTPKKAMVKVPITKELIQDSSPDAEQAIADDVVGAMAALTDAAYIRGTGGATTPLGISGSVLAPQNKFPSIGNDAADVETDLTALMQAVMSANVPLTPESGVWYMNSRSYNFLIKLRDANGNLIYPELRMDSGGGMRIHGFRVFITNNIPNNITVSGSATTGDESEIYFGRAPSLLIGDKQALELEVLENVAYTNGSGSLVSGVDLDSILVKAMLRTDIALRHTTAFAMLTGVQYGVTSDV